jgi:hypothetical protein
VRTDAKATSPSLPPMFLKTDIPLIA